MSSNKSVKEEMIRKYGAKCFIERLRLRDTKGEVYKGKGQYKRMKMLTYHHIRMKSKGGKATIENGAILSAENHAWFHKQPKVEQEKMNQQFQELKREIDHGLTPEEAQQKIRQTEPCEIILAPEEEIEQPFELDIITAETDKKRKYKTKDSEEEKIQ
jgi:hypothetical protein